MSLESLNGKLKKIYAALNSVDGLAAYHYTVPANVTAPYAEWAEDGEGESHHADNHGREQSITGAVNYYTREEFDSTIDDIQEALDALDEAAWSLSAAQYEPETRLIHYTWDFEVW